MAESDKKKFTGFTDVEKSAMRARAQELVKESKANKKKAEGENDVLAAINALKDPDKSMAMRIHELVKSTAPDLWPKTWYGMPAYGTPEGKVILFFKSSQKFNTRYATLGFSDMAKLDDGSMWPTEFAVMKLGSAEEARIVELVKKAIS